MKTSIFILLLTLYSLTSYSNGASSGRSSRDISSDSKNSFEPPAAEDPSSLKKVIPLCTTNIAGKTIRNKANPFSFRALKSFFFKERCKEPESQKNLSKNEKIFHEVLKIALVTLSIVIIAVLVSTASIATLLIVIPL